MSRNRLPKPPKVDEGVIQAQILRYLAFLGFEAYRSPNMPVVRGDKRNGTLTFSKSPVPGLPDITATLPGGRAMYCEVKAPHVGKIPFEMSPEELAAYKARKAQSDNPNKETHEERQSAFLARHQKAGALCFVARSVEDCMRVFKEAGHIP